jgi:hypothetical protein
MIEFELADTGRICQLSDEAATLIAEDERALKVDERWREIADPIEARLTGAETGPILLTRDNYYLFIKPLVVLREGPYRAEAVELLDAIEDASPYPPTAAPWHCASSGVGRTLAFQPATTSKMRRPALSGTAQSLAPSPHPCRQKGG